MPVVAVLMLATPAAAGQPLLAPGDTGLRSDIQLLADAGIISAPVSVWPAARRSLLAELKAQTPPASWRPYLKATWMRVLRELENGPTHSLDIAVVDEPLAVRRFEDSPRATGLGASVSHEAGSFSLTLAGALNESGTGRREELDGSYAGVQLGSWLVSAGAIPRWWGPGYESSLILSTNARPVPALAIDTLEPIRFGARWLRWIGPMHWSVFAGKLESSRAVADARLLGARLTIRPSQSLEIGFSRTAQWGGAGRPDDFDSLVDLLLGRDNRGDAGITLANEPGNQLGGIDLRWSLPAPAAIYLQWIGEDEAGGLPSRFIGLAGAEHWRGWGEGYLRVYGEVAATTVEFYKSRSRTNLAYEHFIYRDGYRFRDRVLGHAMDNDGLMLSVGLMRQSGTRSWQTTLRRIDANYDGRGAMHSVAPFGEDRWELLVSSAHSLWGGELRWGAQLYHVDPNRAATHSELDVYLSWTRHWP